MYIYCHASNATSLFQAGNSFIMHISCHILITVVLFGVTAVPNLKINLQNSKKNNARLILDRDFSTPSAFLFSELKWMSFPDRVIYQKALQMYKTLHGGAPEYLRTPFTFTSEIQSRILRSTCPLQLYSPKPRSELYKRSFQYSGV